VSARGWSESYAYDAFGNVSGGVEGGAGVEDTDRPASLAYRTQVQKAGRTHHEYDAAGRLVRTTRRTLDGRQKTWSYHWDSQDRLVQAVTPDRGTWRYSYDPVGRRTGKYLVGADGALDRRALFIWDGPRLAEEQTPGADGVISATTWDYDPGTFRPAAQRRRGRLAFADADADAVAAADADQSVIDEAFHAIVTDLIGTPTELVTADGRIAWHSTTTVWGGAVGVAADTGSGVDCPLRFPGQYHDDETGLHYNLNRYYDPETAAYLTPDPLGLVPAANDRAYVPNPLTVTDPLGLSYEETTGGGDTPSTGEDTPVDGPSSKYEDITGKGARMKNVATDVGPTEFGSNLEANGWARSDKGPNIMYTKDGARYFLRAKASSYDGWTADFYNAGSKHADIKFRLGDD
jgi:RHS repeat-associated protein